MDRRPQRLCNSWEFAKVGHDWVTEWTELNGKIVKRIVSLLSIKYFLYISSILQYMCKQSTYYSWKIYAFSSFDQELYQMILSKKMITEFKDNIFKLLCIFYKHHTALLLVIFFFSFYELQIFKILGVKNIHGEILGKWVQTAEPVTKMYFALCSELNTIFWVIVFK